MSRSTLKVHPHRCEISLNAHTFSSDFRTTRGFRTDIVRNSTSMHSALDAYHTFFARLMMKTDVFETLHFN